MISLVGSNQKRFAKYIDVCQPDLYVGFNQILNLCACWVCKCLYNLTAELWLRGYNHSDKRLLAVPKFYSSVPKFKKYFGHNFASDAPIIWIDDQMIYVAQTIELGLFIDKIPVFVNIGAN